MQGRSYRGARNCSPGSGVMGEEERDSLGSQGCAAKNTQVCPLPPPLGSHGGPLFWGPPSLCQATGSPRSPPSSVVLIQAVCPGSPLSNPFFGRNPGRGEGSVQPNTPLSRPGKLNPKYSFLPFQQAFLNGLSLTKAFCLEFSLKHFFTHNCISLQIAER